MDNNAPLTFKFAGRVASAGIILALVLAVLAGGAPPMPAAVSASAFDAQQTAAPTSQRSFPPEFMGIAGITGWTVSGSPERYPKDGLFGYMDGGAEIFLQYGFRNLTVFKLVPSAPAGKAKEITLEIYRMETAPAAFGIFSTRREGGEAVLPGIKTIHWVGPEQANLVKGDLYVNILASGCTQAEVEDFTLSVDRELPPAESLVPPGLESFPEFNLVPRTERYIRGGAAAAGESPLLAAGFWGFAEGNTEAYSVKYGAGQSKIVIFNFKQPPQDLPDKVYRLFKEHSMDVWVQDNIMQGVTVVGRYFYFGQNGPNGVLILDEPDPKVARTYIQQALDKAAKRLKERSDKSKEEIKK